MAKRETTFDWVREDVEGEARERVTRRDKGGERRLRERLEAIAMAISALQPAERARLPLEPDAAKALETYVASGPTPAKRRALLRLVAMLRFADLEALDAELSGDTVHSEQLREMERWRERLIAEGDEAAFAFCEAYPAADRQQLRQLAREAGKEGGRGARAAKKLFALLRAASEGR